MRCDVACIDCLRLGGPGPRRRRCGAPALPPGGQLGRLVRLLSCRSPPLDAVQEFCAGAALDPVLPKESRELGHCGARLLHPNEGVHDEAARPIRLQNIDDLDPA